MIYDAAIIGAGATGASTAWHLSHKNLKTILIEKSCDAGFGVSKANSGIIHGGFHHSTSTLKAKLEVEAIPMFDDLCAELHFPFSRCGIIVAAFSEEEIDTCRKLYERGLANGINDLKWCSKAEILELEPKLSPQVTGGFYAPQGGVIEPYNYVFRLAHSAKLNGVDFCCSSKVISGEFRDGIWHLQTDNGTTICARYVVNAAGLFADEISRCCGAEDFTIHPRKGEEYLLDRLSPARPEHVIFPVPSKHSKGVLVIPTVGGTTMIGPTADIVDDKEDTATTAENFKRIADLVRPMISGIRERDLITAFSGLRPVLDSEDFYIEYSKLVPNFIQAAGIQSPGLTASPAIGRYIVQLLADGGLEMSDKTEPRKHLPENIEARNCDLEKLAKLHENDPDWTDLVCRCEKISVAEVVEAIHHGHTTLDGVKFYTRAGMGRCQGGFCAAKIMRIISEVAGIPYEELTKRGGGTRLLSGKLGDLKVREVKK